jgi:hypothetical protein
MAKKGFKAVALNDSFDEPPRRHREEEEEEEEENDDDINNNESEATPSSTATKNNNNDEFVTPMTTFHSTKTNANDSATNTNNNTKTTTTFIGVGSNEKIVGSNESSPNSATRQSMESRDTISELPQTPKRDLMYFQRGGGEDFRHQHNRSISATSMDGLISRLDEESGSGGGERTSVRFNEFSDAFGGRLGARESAAATTNNAFVRACSKALDIPWCFGETRRTRKNVVATVVVLLLILFAAIPLRHWKHMSR